MTGATRAASVCPAMEDQRSPHDDPAGSRRRETFSGMESGMDTGMRVLSYLIAGVMVYGLLGWVGDHFLGTRFLLPVGIIAGAAFGVYVVIRRFGQVSEPAAKNVSARAGTRRTTEGDR